MLLQNDTDRTILLEADGKRTELRPGENTEVSYDVKVAHLYLSPPVKPVEAVEERLKALAARVFQVDESKVVPSAALASDLNASAVDLVLFISEVEKSFGVKISVVEAQQIMTIEDALNLLASKGVS